MKRVLIHTLIFSPDGVSMAYLDNDIALLKLSEVFRHKPIRTGNF